MIGVDDFDTEDQWLLTAKQEASKLKKSDGLHMLIAMVGGDLDQARNLINPSNTRVNTLLLQFVTQHMILPNFKCLRISVVLFEWNRRSKPTINSKAMALTKIKVAISPLLG